jgi:hypothetical protein
MRATWLERYDAAVRSRYTRLTNWHTVLAWLPVEVAPGEYRWLEHVERKLTYHGGSYGNTFVEAEYRALSKPKPHDETRGRG